MNFSESLMLSRLMMLTLVAHCSILPLSAQQSGTQKQKGVSDTGKYSPAPAPSSTGREDISPEQAQKKMKDSMKVERINEQQYRIGKVILDKKARTVSFPVKVNMRLGVVEYALVTENGKSHESIFTTTASPSHVHLACVLLGMKQASYKDWPKDHTEITSDRGVEIIVTWPTNGPDKVLTLASCISLVDPNLQHEGGSEVAAGTWFYNGSSFRNGTFAANNEGSMISIIADGEALLNGLRVGRENDELHAANKSVLPAAGKTLKMVLTIPKVKS